MYVGIEALLYETIIRYKQSRAFKINEIGYMGISRIIFALCQLIIYSVLFINDIILSNARALWPTKGLADYCCKFTENLWKFKSILQILRCISYLLSLKIGHP